MKKTYVNKSGAEVVPEAVDCDHFCSPKSKKIDTQRGKTKKGGSPPKYKMSEDNLSDLASPLDRPTSPPTPNEIQKPKKLTLTNLHDDHKQVKIS